jgi:uncharacterized coiled-coil DUF342 family protein
MRSKSTVASLVAAVGLSLCLAACKDTKTLQENEQLKAQVADLQKQNGEMGNNLETVTAARDALTKENDSLRAEIQALKSKKGKKKVSTRKHHRNQSTSKASAYLGGAQMMGMRERVFNSTSQRGDNRYEII